MSCDDLAAADLLCGTGDGPRRVADARWTARTSARAAPGRTPAGSRTGASPRFLTVIRYVMRSPGARTAFVSSCRCQLAAGLLHRPSNLADQGRYSE